MDLNTKTTSYLTTGYDPKIFKDNIIFLKKTERYSPPRDYIYPSGLKFYINESLYNYNLRTKEEINIVKNASIIFPTIDENKVFWEENRSLYFYDLITHKIKKLSLNMYSNIIPRHVYLNKIYLSKSNLQFTTSNTSLYIFDIETENTETINLPISSKTAYRKHSDFYKNNFAWIEDSEAPFSPCLKCPLQYPGKLNQTIWLYDIATGTKKIIAKTKDQTRISIYEDKIVTTGDNTITVYYLDNENKLIIPLSKNVQIHPQNVDLWEKYILWKDGYGQIVLTTIKE